MTSTSTQTVSVEPYGDRDVQYFCSRDDYCAHELQRQSNRKGTFHGLCKQGEDMITSSNKRLKTIHAGENVKISIPVVDRAPLGPTSLSGVVMKVISDGSAFMIGTKDGIISTSLSYSDITQSNTTQLLHPEQVPDTHTPVGQNGSPA